MIATAKKEVLNPWERELFNLLEEYFYLRQRRSNRMPVLAQVGLTRIIDVLSPKIGEIQVNAMSVDLLVVTGDKSKPRLVVEADGKHHNNSPAQIARDNLKNHLLASAGIPILRVEVEGKKENLDVLLATVEIPEFDRELEYPVVDSFGRSFTLNYSGKEYDSGERVLALLDIELSLVEIGWEFPDGWDYVSELWQTHTQSNGVWKKD